VTSLLLAAAIATAAPVARCGEADVDAAYAHTVAKLAAFLKVDPSDCETLREKLLKADYINLNGDGVSDLSPLEGLTKVERFYAEDNEISDLSALAGFSKLRQLLVGRNQIRDLSPIAGLPLQELDVHDNPLEALDGLPLLRELKLSLSQETVFRAAGMPRPEMISWWHATGTLKHRPVGTEAGERPANLRIPLVVRTKATPRDTWDALEVLDIAGGQAAMRLVWHDEFGMTTRDGYTIVRSHNCSYGGMGAHPHSGVQLERQPLGGPVAETWTVYGVASSAKECTPHEQSTEALAAAKADFAAHNLDVNGKPTFVEADADGTLTLDSDGRQWVLKPWRRGASWGHPLHADLAEVGAKTNDWLVEFGLAAGDEAVIRLLYGIGEDPVTSVTFQRAWLLEEGVVFAVREGQGEAGDAWHLTAPVPLPTR